jgi:hypothetical protein
VKSFLIFLVIIGIVCPRTTARADLNHGGSATDYEEPEPIRVFDNTNPEGGDSGITDAELSQYENLVRAEEQRQALEISAPAVRKVITIRRRVETRTTTVPQRKVSAYQSPSEATYRGRSKVDDYGTTSANRSALPSAAPAVKIVIEAKGSEVSPGAANADLLPGTGSGEKTRKLGPVATSLDGMIWNSAGQPTGNSRGWGGPTDGATNRSVGARLRELYARMAALMGRRSSSQVLLSQVGAASAPNEDAALRSMDPRSPARMAMPSVVQDDDPDWFTWIGWLAAVFLFTLLVSRDRRRRTPRH